MHTTSPERFDDVSVICKANVYFDGKVVSHSVHFADGSKKTLGLIFPGSFTFNTDAAERMEITAGACRVKIGDATSWRNFEAGKHFDVPAQSRFEIAVDEGTTQYICTFLPA